MPGDFWLALRKTANRVPNRLESLCVRLVFFPQHCIEKFRAPLPSLDYVGFCFLRG